VLLAFFAGTRVGSRAESQSAPAPVPLQGDDAVAFEKHLRELRSGDAAAALEGLLAMEGRQPGTPSLTYLSALAALQSGDTVLAEKKARESTSKRERVSDALALLAVIEAGKSGAGLGDPRIRGEWLLRDAAATDPANPRPLLELASMLRQQKRNGEARSFLEASRSRLTAVDSQSAVMASISLLDLEETPDDKLPASIPVLPEPSSLFAAAYLQMRKGDHGAAAAILREAKIRLPGETYLYLVNDPSLRKFARSPEYHRLS